MAEDKKYKSKFDLPVFILILIPSVALDIISILVPVFATFWILVLRLLFFLMGINNSATNWGAGIGSMVELFPGLSALPGATVYVSWVYALEKGKEESPTLAKADKAARPITKGPL